MLSLPRIGSGTVYTGRSTQSELAPGAWLVLEPSKPQMSGSFPSATIRVLLRMIGLGLVPSIQMYSAWYGIHCSLVGRDSSRASPPRSLPLLPIREDQVNETAGNIAGRRSRR